MKKATSLCLVAIIAIFATIQLTSCKKDKSEPKTMIGTWNSSTFYTKETTDGAVTSEGTINFPGLLAMTFNKDMTYKRFTPLDPTESENGTYQTNGNRLILNYVESGVSVSDTMEYEFSENTFITKEIITEVIDSKTVITEDKITFTRG
ncbi:MAG: hypothetical protein V4561_13455 [Bacteroidota bacterium]